jgi:hypothetical protein
MFPHVLLQYKTQKTSKSWILFFGSWANSCIIKKGNYFTLKNMKITLIAVFLAALVGANDPTPPADTKAAFDMMRAKSLLDVSIETFKKSGPTAVSLKRLSVFCLMR